MRFFFLLLLVVAPLGGAAVAELIRPAPDDSGPIAEGAAPTESDTRSEGPRRIVNLERRLIVPIVTQRQTRAVVLLDVAMDVPEEHGEATHANLPRLRDAFLRTMLSLAASGAFGRGVAAPDTVAETRRLLEADARRVLALRDADVLILEALVRGV